MAINYYFRILTLIDSQIYILLTSTSIPHVSVLRVCIGLLEQFILHVPKNVQSESKPKSVSQVKCYKISHSKMKNLTPGGYNTLDRNNRVTSYVVNVSKCPTFVALGWPTTKLNKLLLRIEH